MDGGHALQALHNVHTYGMEPVWAECTCGWRSEAGDRVAVAAAFDDHTLAESGGLVITPWRSAVAS